uniref:ATP-dependent RNA helicase DDX50 n=1 Tax=Phallusia mammillata TaxID=59560 RepID=A0A6F9DBB4_9ASCI|nr:ATP-dependent RNA helicase DDX50 [Phallusia mammillata]
MAHLARGGICKFCVSSVRLLAQPKVLQKTTIRTISSYDVSNLRSRKLYKGFVEFEVLSSTVQKLIASDQLTLSNVGIILRLVDSDKLVGHNLRQDLLQKIHDNFKTKDVIFYNAYIQSMLDNNVEFVVDEVLQAMEACNVAPNTETFSKLVVKSCKDGNLKDASGFIAYMKDNSMKVPIKCFVHIAEAQCAVGETDKAQEIMSHMMENNFPLRWSDIAVYCCGLLKAKQTENFQDIILQYRTRVGTKIPLQYALPIISSLQKNQEFNDLLLFLINHVDAHDENNYTNILDALDMPNFSKVMKNLYTSSGVKFSKRFDKLAEAYLFDTLNQEQSIEAIQNEVSFLENHHPETDFPAMVLPLLVSCKKHLVLDYLVTIAPNEEIKPHYVLPLVEDESDLEHLKDKLALGFNVEERLLNQKKDIFVKKDIGRKNIDDYAEQQLTTTLSEILKKSLFDHSINTEELAKQLWDQLETDLPQATKFEILSKPLVFDGCLKVFSGKGLHRYLGVLKALHSFGFQFDDALLQWCYRKLPKTCQIQLELIDNHRKSVRLVYLTKILDNPSLVAKTLVNENNSKSSKALLTAALDTFKESNQMKTFEDALKSNNCHLAPQLCNDLFWHFVSVGQVSDLKSLFADHIFDDDITSIPTKYLEFWSKDLSDFLLDRLSEKYGTSEAKLILYLSLLEGNKISDAEKIMDGNISLTPFMKETLSYWTKAAVHNIDYQSMCLKVLNGTQSVMESDDYMYLVNAIIQSLTHSTDFQMIENVLNDVYSLLTDDLQKQISTDHLKALQEHFLLENREPPELIFGDKELFELVRAVLNEEWTIAQCLSQIEKLANGGGIVSDRLFAVISERAKFDEFEDFQNQLKRIIPNYDGKKQKVSHLLDNAGVREAIDFVMADTINIGAWKEIVSDICNQALGQDEGALLETIKQRTTNPPGAHIVKSHLVYQNLLKNEDLLEDLKHSLVMRDLIKLILERNDKNAMDLLKEKVQANRELLCNYVAGLIVNGSNAEEIYKFTSAMSLAEKKSLCPLVYSRTKTPDALVKIDSIMRQICPISARLNYFFGKECANLDLSHNPELLTYFKSRMHELPWFHNYHQTTEIFAKLQHQVFFRPTTRSFTSPNEKMIDELLALSN